MWKRNVYLAPEGDAPAGGATGGTGGGEGAGATGATPGAGATAGGATGATAGATGASNAGGEDTGYWPSDWREKVSKGDEKLSARFSRYGSPEAALTALIAAQNKISSGELKPVLDKEAKPEDVAAYRKAHGIPEAPDKYDLSDLKVEVHDKEFMGEILKVAHATHQKPEQIKPLIKAFYDLAAKSEQARMEEDSRIAKEAEDALRAEWGGEYRRHTNLINGLMDLTGDAKLNEQLMNGRLADGTLVKNSPGMQKFLLQLALINNPTGTLVSTGGNQMQGLDEEISKIEKTMRTDRSAYNKDAKMQARYRELITAKSTLADRKAA